LACRRASATGRAMTAVKVRARPGARTKRNTRADLLAAAREEFVDKGLKGARVDQIAARAGANKQLVYYYFANKEGLYLAVLEAAYEKIRSEEQALALSDKCPVEAMRALIAFTFDYMTRNRDFVALLRDENLHRAQHIKRSEKIGRLHTPFVETIARTLARGEKEGVLRKGVDPVQFYISLAALCYFYYANIHTLSVVFDRALESEGAVKDRRAHVMEFVMAYLRPDGATPRAPGGAGAAFRC